MGTAMHPASVVRLHLQGVDERVLQAVLFKVVGESLMAELSNHGHDGVCGSLPCRSLDVRQDLWVVSLIGNPAHLGSLHGVPEAHPLGVIAPGL